MRSISGTQVPEIASRFLGAQPNRNMGGEAISIGSGQAPQSQPWQLMVDPPMDPQANMARDEELTTQVRQGLFPAALRIYRWNRSAISIGRRQSMEGLPMDLLTKGFSVVRRPTGGGAVVHRLDEVTYALAISVSDTLSTFLKMHRCLTPKWIPERIHQHLRDELVNRGLLSSEDLRIFEANPSRGPVPTSRFPSVLCFEAPVCGDLLYRGRKVAGAALRAWREGFLIQGSIQGLPVDWIELIGFLIQVIGSSRQ